MELRELFLCTKKTKIMTLFNNWPIGKPLLSNADEPMAVEYQLHGERNSDIFRFQRHRETLEDPKRSSVWMVFMLQKWKNIVPVGTCNTDSRYPERMGNIIYFITFTKPKQNRAKCP